MTKNINRLVGLLIAILIPVLMVLMALAFYWVFDVLSIFLADYNLSAGTTIIVWWSVIITVLCYRPCVVLVECVHQAYLERKEWQEDQKKVKG